MPAAERKRPWYLVLALFGALALGSLGACGGWTTIGYYREEIDVSVVGRTIADDADRTAVVLRMQGYLASLDAAKARGWPLAVASLLLGTAILVFAMRALGGSAGARAALVQLVLVQAGVTAAHYWLMRDVLRAESAVNEALLFAREHESMADRWRADEVARAASAVWRAASPVFLVLRTLGSALIVVALTQRRSRDFFDANAPAVEER